MDGYLDGLREDGRESREKDACPWGSKGKEGDGTRTRLKQRKEQDQAPKVPSWPVLARDVLGVPGVETRGSSKEGPIQEQEGTNNWQPGFPS